MRPNKLHKAIRGGRATVGAWIAFTDPTSAEVMARAGFDWLNVDMEHCPFTIQHVQSILLGIQQTEAAAIVRPLGKNPDFIKQVLDLGADGVMIPQVNTADEARAAVQAAKYHPLGRRAFGPLRAMKYANMDEYLATANDYHLLILQIETAQGLDNLEEILSVKGIDGVFFGHGDYSHSIGLLGQMRAPEVLQAEQQFYALANKAGIPAGSIAPTDEIFARCIKMGGRLVTRRGDISYVMAGAAADVAAARKTLAPKS